MREERTGDGGRRFYIFRYAWEKFPDCDGARQLRGVWHSVRKEIFTLRESNGEPPPREKTRINSWPTMPASRPTDRPTL